MGIQSIPQELIVMVGENLSIKDLNNFLCTCHGLLNLFTPRLHKLGMQNVGRLSALQWAAKRGYEPLVKLAILNGAKVNAITKCRLKYTVLHLAATSVSPNPRIIRTLVEHGAKIGAKDSDLRTPLYRATCYGRGQVVEELLRLGAGTKEGGSNGLIALAHIAAGRGDADCMQAFIAAGVDFHARGDFCRTILHVAIAGSSGLGMAQYLLEQEGGRMTVNAEDSDGSTPLHLLMDHYYLTSVEKSELLRSLLQCGADIHVKDKYGETPAHIAIDKDDISSVSELIRAGFNVCTKGAGGDTVLHRAVCGRGRGMKFLLALEAGRSIINVRNKKGATPLHLAVKECDRVKVELLLRYGANTDLRNRKGKTPPQVAVLQGKDSLVEAFKDAGVDFNSEKHMVKALSKENRIRQKRQ